MGFINQLITEGAPSCMNLHLHLRTETHQPGISAWHFPHARTLNLEHTRYVPPLPLCCTVVLCDKVGPQTMWKIGISRAVVPQWGKSRAELVRLYSNSHETYMVYGRYLTNYSIHGVYIYKPTFTSRLGALSVAWYSSSSLWYLKLGLKNLICFDEFRWKTQPLNGPLYRVPRQPCFTTQEGIPELARDFYRYFVEVI